MAAPVIVRGTTGKLAARRSWGCWSGGRERDGDSPAGSQSSSIVNTNHDARKEEDTPVEKKPASEEEEENENDAPSLFI